MARAPRATGKDDVRRLNQDAVFQVVHRHGPVSRVDIAGHLHLSPATVTNITGDLIERGLVFEARKGDAVGVGRKPILLEVDYDAGTVMGVKVANVGLTCALTNLNAEVARAARYPLRRTDPDAVVDAIAAAFADLAPHAAQPIAAVGVDLPGLVDADRRTVRHSPLLGWQRVPLAERLEARLGVPVVVENDVNALALAEAWYGVGRSHESFLVLTLGRGVGLGLVLGGDVYRGPFGGAGEIGHVLIDPAGPATRYAAPGTLEAYLSDDALVREARARVPGFAADDAVERLAALADAGDPAARAVYDDAGRVLGRALALLVNLLAPGLIVLSGEGLRAAPHLIPTAEAELHRLAFGDLADRVQLVVEPWGDDAWARGAAALAASRFLVESATAPRGD